MYRWEKVIPMLTYQCFWVLLVEYIVLPQSKCVLEGWTPSFCVDGIQNER